MIARIEGVVIRGRPAFSELCAILSVLCNKDSCDTTENEIP